MNTPEDNKQNHPPRIELKTKDGELFNIPVEGSLGLLALGYVGLIAWRKKRKEAKKANS